MPGAMIIAESGIPGSGKLRAPPVVNNCDITIHVTCPVYGQISVRRRTVHHPLLGALISKSLSASELSAGGRVVDHIIVRRRLRSAKIALTRCDAICPDIRVSARLRVDRSVPVKRTSRIVLVRRQLPRLSILLGSELPSPHIRAGIGFSGSCCGGAVSSLALPASLRNLILGDRAGSQGERGNACDK